MDLIKTVLGDAILTSMWVFSLPFFGIITSIISSYIGIEPKSLATLFISVNVSTLFVMTFSILGAVMGGASFNPSTTVSLYTAGFKPQTSLLSLAARFPAQAAGGAGGARAIMQVMPSKYKHVLKGPSLMVDLHKGAVVEGFLSFLFCFALLLIMIKGPKNLLIKIWLLSVVTLTLVVTGGKYTGPSLNPANAFGWAYVNNWHNTRELFYVYWICPFIGAVFAAWVLRFLFKPPVVKQKKA